MVGRGCGNGVLLSANTAAGINRIAIAATTHRSRPAMPTDGLRCSRLALNVMAVPRNKDNPEHESRGTLECSA